MICQGCQTESPSGLRCECNRLFCPRCFDAHTCQPGAAVPPLWPHQVRAIAQAEEAERRGVKRLVIVAPTGGGKTRIMAERAARAAEQGERVAIFTGRRLLTKQAADTLARHGVRHALLAAGFPVDLSAPVQICSVQTIASRVFERERWHLPEADKVFIDEAHSNKAQVARKIISHYVERGAVINGYSATPVGLGGLYDELIHAGTHTELRRCGALVPCIVYAPDEPDLKGVHRTPVGEFVQGEVVKRVMQTVVFGRVFDQWAKLCPARKHTLLFAPGVKESRWFVEEFGRRGVKAAHLDADTPDEERDAIVKASERGEVQVISSFGVLREGADLPWIRHGILVQVCGCLSTYLQIVGRILRAYPGKTQAVLQDHAGAWHRHGSPNADRVWELGDTDKGIAERQQKARQEGKESEPIRCPECGGIRSRGPACPHCGHQHSKSVRLVRMTDGNLVQVTGNVTKKSTDNPYQKVWNSCLFAAGNARQTLAQAAARFQQRTGYEPQGLRNLPAPGSLDWNRKVAQVYPWTVKRRETA